MAERVGSEKSIATPKGYLAEREGFPTNDRGFSKNTVKYGIPEKAGDGLRPPVCTTIFGRKGDAHIVGRPEVGHYGRLVEQSQHLGRGLQPARGGPACPAIDPVLDDGLLLGWLKIFEDRREERLDVGPHGGILAAGRTALLDEVVNVLAVAPLEVAVAQQALQPSPQRQAKYRGSRETFADRATKVRDGSAGDVGMQ
jgi:hypothetical protein